MNGKRRTLINVGAYMKKDFFDNVVGKIKDDGKYWYSENVFSYENEIVYLLFHKNGNDCLTEKQQINYLSATKNLSKIINKSLQLFKNLFYEDKLSSVRFKHILFEDENYFTISCYFLKEKFEFTIQFDMNCEPISFNNTKILK